VKSKTLFLILLLILINLNGCKTVKNKADEIIKKENEKLSQFIGQPVSELKIVMGLPDIEEKSNTGTKVFVYKTRKYGIPCERKFEISNNNMIIGFVSKGCF
tara:strand:- start:229 stop:534 length:306 start_codon:yes stop_codon:yes gene_type:complete